MKKVIIAAVALLIVAGGSFGAFLVVKNKSDKETEKQVSELADNVLFSFDSDSITEINFDCPDGQYKAVVNDDGDWKLDNREFSLDQTYMDALLTLVSDFTAETNYGEADSSKKSMYGLENPSETITLSDGTNNYKIYVGNISPTNDYYYIMVEGKNKVYTVDSIQGSVLKASRLMIKSKDLIPYKDIDKVYPTISGTQYLAIFSNTWLYDTDIDMGIGNKSNSYDIMRFPDAPEAESVLRIFTIVPIVIALIGVAVWLKRRYA